MLTARYVAESYGAIDEQDMRVFRITELLSDPEPIDLTPPKILERNDFLLNGKCRCCKRSKGKHAAWCDEVPLAFFEDLVFKRLEQAGVDRRRLTIKVSFVQLIVMDSL